MAMPINFTMYGSGASIMANGLRVEFSEAESPAAIVAQQWFAPPHTFPQAVTQIVDNPVIHLVRIYSAPDEPTLGVLVSDFMYKPNYSTIEVRVRLAYIVGETAGGPNIGDTSFAIPDSEGWDWYPVIRSLGGELVDVSEYDETDAANGILTPLQPDFTFMEGDAVFIHFKPRITSIDPVINFQTQYTGVQVITADATAGPTWFNVMTEIAAPTSASTVVITLPLLSTVPDNRMFRIRTNFGPQFQTKFVTSAGELIKIGVGVTQLELGQGEFLNILKATVGGVAAYYVDGISDGYYKVGTLCYSDDTDMLNKAILDGGPMLGWQYPRVLRYINNLPGGVLKTYADRQANYATLRGFWAYDAGTDTIYRPDRRELTYKSIVGSIAPGTYEEDGVGEHTHWAVYNQFENHNGFPVAPLVANPVGAAGANLSIVGRFNKADGGGKESYYLAGTAAEANTGKTGGVRAGQTKTTVESVYSIPLCYI